MNELVSSSIPLPSRRLPALDGLRFVAALAVVIFHFTASPYGLGWSIPAPQGFSRLAQFTVYGAMGVQLFFVVSGFVILMSAWGRTIPQFVGSRVGRIFPAYIFAVLLTGVLYPIIIGGEVNLPKVLMNLTMLQQPFGVQLVDGVYWTMWVEICFYVLIGIVLLRGITVGRVTALVAFWPLVAILIRNVDTRAADFFQPLFAPLFAAGMGLYLIYAFGHSLLRWALVAFNAVMAAHLTSGTWMRWTSESVGVRQDPLVSYFVVIGLIALVAVCVLTPLRQVGGKYATLAGSLTYPLYLTHVYWGLLVVGLVEPALGKWGALVVAIAAVVAFAYVIVRYVERPLGPKLRRNIESALSREIK